MPKFTVPVIIEINGSIDVEAESEEQAHELAQEEYDRRYRANMKGTSFGALACNVIDCPDINVEFADPEDIEPSDEEDEDEG
jgi:hypothetical protein